MTNLRCVIINKEMHLFGSCKGATYFFGYAPLLHLHSSGWMWVSWNCWAKCSDTKMKLKFRWWPHLPRWEGRFIENYRNHLQIDNSYELREWWTSKCIVSYIVNILVICAAIFLISWYQLVRRMNWPWISRIVRSQSFRWPGILGPLGSRQWISGCGQESIPHGTLVSRWWESIRPGQLRKDSLSITINILVRCENAMFWVKSSEWREMIEVLESVKWKMRFVVMEVCDMAYGSRSILLLDRIFWQQKPSTAFLVGFMTQPFLRVVVSMDRSSICVSCCL